MALTHMAVRDYGRDGTEGIYEPGISFASIVDDIRSGQIDKIDRVLAIDEDAGTVENVTADVAEALLEFYIDDLSQSALQFFERFGRIADELEEPALRDEHSTLNGAQQGARLHARSMGRGPFGD